MARFENSSIIIPWLVVFLVLQLVSTALIHEGVLSSVVGQRSLSPEVTTAADVVTKDGRVDETISNYCRQHQLFNNTWGSSVSRFVDKYDTKILVETMSKEIKIAPTVALYDATNLSLFTVDQLVSLSASKNLIIKPTHAWARTARVWNRTYNCFRKCDHSGNTPISVEENPTRAHQLAFENMRYPIEKLPPQSYLLREPQYIGLPKRVIIEEHLDPSVQEYHWWIVHGSPVFVCARCDAAGQKRGSYYTTDFRKLNIRGDLSPCGDDLRKPTTWSLMEKIVKDLGRHVPGVVSVDLYANETDVFFSEFTLARHCAKPFRPWVADSLLYKLHHRKIELDAVTPDLVFGTIQGRSWLAVGWNKNGKWRSASFPSAVDLCSAQTRIQPKKCLQLSQRPHGENESTHCVMLDMVGAERGSSKVRTISIDQTATISGVISRVDWPLVLVLVGLLIILWRVPLTKGSSLCDRGQRMTCCLLYLCTVAVYKWFQPQFTSWINPDTNLIHTVKESFEAFRIVHPVNSVALCLSHFATYWPPLAAMQSRSVTRMLQWWLVYEGLTSLVNEWHHHDEVDPAIQCTRVAFIAQAKQYVLNDIVRAYLLPPIFVYGYLLPKFLVRYVLSLLEFPR